jgi:hypothetical protein
MGLDHGELNPLPRRGLDRAIISCIRVTRHANPRIIRQHSLEAHPHLGRPVGDDHLPGVK